MGALRSPTGESIAPRAQRRGAESVRHVALALALCAVFASAPGRAQELSGKDIVDRTERLLYGKTLQGEFEMKIATPRWQRTLAMKVWMDRPTRTFIRIVSPAKEAGIGSLRIGDEMWNYLPSIERIVKIPPTMMLQPWMGSDFTNDDLVKEASMTEDYTHRVLGIERFEGAEAYRVELLPKADSAVVWGKVVYLVRTSDFVPLQTTYYDERGALVRTMTFKDVKGIGGRTVPTVWEMRPADKPANVTSILFKSPVWDRPIDPEVFTQRNLQRK